MVMTCGNNLLIILCMKISIFYGLRLDSWRKGGETLSVGKNIHIYVCMAHNEIIDYEL